MKGFWNDPDNPLIVKIAVAWHIVGITVIAVGFALLLVLSGLPPALHRPGDGRAYVPRPATVDGGTAGHE